jgi:CheY-like chemotaxis protein
MGKRAGRTSCGKGLGAEALIAIDSPEKIDLLLTDMMMPGA